MKIDKKEKNEIKKAIVASLRDEAEIQKIIIFGSFLASATPNDIDVAVLQNSSAPYLPLALKYRKKIRMISKRIPVDIIPLRLGALKGLMADEIFRGEVIYEIGGVLTDFEPDSTLCNECLKVAKRIAKKVQELIT